MTIVGSCTGLTSPVEGQPRGRERRPWSRRRRARRQREDDEREPGGPRGGAS